MTIALLCPNGHKLICPDEQAGKRGKCPQCGATFRVPDLNAPGASGPLSSPAAATAAVVAKSGSSPSALGGGSGVAVGSSPRLSPASLAPVPLPGVQLPPGSGPIAPILINQPPAAPPNPIQAISDETTPVEGDISFLCPNGHQLAGNASLGGQPGECPVCGTKFIVPTEEELDQHEVPFNPLLHGAPNQVAGAVPFGQQRRSMIDFFERIWAYKSHGGVIEVYLKEGSSLVPDGYAPVLSQLNEAVFLVREAENKYLVAVVAWDAISHLTLRGLETPPESVFDVP
jgi:hypothetical protein